MVVCFGHSGFLFVPPLRYGEIVIFTGHGEEPWVSVVLSHMMQKRFPVNWRPRRWRKSNEILISTKRALLAHQVPHPEAPFSVACQSLVSFNMHPYVPSLFILDTSKGVLFSLRRENIDWFCLHRNRLIFGRILLWSTNMSSCSSCMNMQRSWF